MNEVMLEKLHKAMEAMGFTHTLKDILNEITEGTMQSFVQGDTWCVTRVFKAPQKKVLEVFLLVGEEDKLDEMHRAVEDYAKKLNVDFMRTFARPGWRGWAAKYGWRRSAEIYRKDLK